MELTNRHNLDLSGSHRYSNTIGLTPTVLAAATTTPIATTTTTAPPHTTTASHTATAPRFHLPPVYPYPVGGAVLITPIVETAAPLTIATVNDAVPVLTTTPTTYSGGGGGSAPTSTTGSDTTTTGTGAEKEIWGMTPTHAHIVWGLIAVIVAAYVYKKL